jgi:hypothetical protein
MSKARITVPDGLSTDEYRSMYDKVNRLIRGYHGQDEEPPQWMIDVWNELFDLAGYGTMTDGSVEGYDA